MDKKEEVLRVLPGRLRDVIGTARVAFLDWREIRLRAGKPLILQSAAGERMFESIVSEREIRECLQAAANYSLYAYEEEVRQGYLTIRGGHRIGLAGHVILEQGRIRTMKQVSSLNIRVAHEVRGCAKKLWEPLFGDGCRHNVLFISPPGAGKTTCLRDLVRLLSERSVNVSVVDERGELGACHQGVPQHDLGPRTDILDGCPKADGIYLLLRSMAPDFIAVDEISLPEDARAVAYAAGCGCHFLATLHGAGMDALRRPALRDLWEARLFDRYVVLGQSPGWVTGIYDRYGHLLTGQGDQKGGLHE